MRERYQVTRVDGEVQIWPVSKKGKRRSFVDLVDFVPQIQQAVDDTKGPRYRERWTAEGEGNVLGHFVIKVWNQ